VRRETGRGKERFKILGLFADELCSQAILDFLAAAPRMWGSSPTKPAEEDAQSEASEWELRERNEREEEQEVAFEIRLFFCNFLSALYLSRDRPGRRAEEDPQRAERTAEGNGLCVSP